MQQINNYTPEKIRRMQKRAVERVHNIAEIEKRAIENFNSKFPKDKKEKDKKENYLKEEENIRQENINSNCAKGWNRFPKNNSFNFDINNFINLLANDSEKTLIICLILLLISDNEQPEIIFALIYILI